MSPIGPGARYAIVGDGRLARHLTHYFRRAGLEVATWSRRDQQATGRRLSDAVADAAVVLLLINDDAIVPFVEAHPELGGRTLVHCAGALVAPGLVGLHPLMTFGPELLPLAAYQAVPFVGDRGRPGLRDLFPTLPNPSYAVDPAHRALYHALVTLAGNLTPVLWERLVIAVTEELGLPREVIGPYFDAVVARCRGPLPFAATGPITRGDRATIRAHRAALEGHPLAPVYEGFVRALRPELLEPR